MSMKGKKVACFIALPHHTRMMLPVAQEVRKRGGTVVFFLSLQDYPFELDLRKKGQQYRFLTDYLDDETKKQIEHSLDAFLNGWLKRCFRWDGFRHWPLFEQNRHIESAIQEYYCVQRFIEQEQPDLFLALHERNRWGKIIGFQAERHGVPYVTFQEGDYHESRLSFSAHAEYSTIDILWGEATRATLTAHHASADKMVLAGNTHLDEAVALNSDRGLKRRLRKEFGIPDNRKIVVVLIDLEWSIMIDERVWQPFFENVPDNVSFIFKWHPNAVLSTYEKARDAIQKISPETKVLYTYNAYHLLALADYCVTLGKTTLALEALVFGKPLFATPTRDGTKDYYLNNGVAQSVWPFGNWTALQETIELGLPPAVAEKVSEYLEASFFFIDGKATERSVDVLETVVEAGRKRTLVHSDGLLQRVNGKVSFIIPSGNNMEALLATLQSLAENVTLRDWETVIVVSDDSAQGLLSGLSGDLSVVTCHDGRLATLFNTGAKVASGEFLVFLEPGTLLIKDAGLSDMMPKGIVGVPVCNEDGEVIAGTYRFDFNYVPQEAALPIDADTPVDALGGGLLAVPADVFLKTGGFDESVANHLVEVDFCMNARLSGEGLHVCRESLALRFVQVFHEAEPSGFAPELPDALTWRGRVHFYAKWWGKLPKSDDYIAYAGELMRI